MCAAILTVTIYGFLKISGWEWWMELYLKTSALKNDDLCSLKNIFINKTLV
jgi:hypothetical protein